ncbi:MAG: hypothetical protein Q8K43_08785 [Sulfurimicrobium sp.]|nr:hypothetical protein [Sulfurimicrobium sp.]
MALNFHKALNAWGTPEFAAALKQEIAQADPALLPLQQGLSIGSHATDGPVGAMLLKVDEDEGMIRAKAGIFYTSIIAGCSCADDPTPISENNEYCEMQFDIDRITGETVVTVLAD